MAPCCVFCCMPKLVWGGGTRSGFALANKRNALMGMFWFCCGAALAVPCIGLLQTEDQEARTHCFWCNGVEVMLKLTMEAFCCPLYGTAKCAHSEGL